VLELAIMIEGQDGLTWPRWQRLAKAVEALGFAGLYRSDHFTNPEGPPTDALDLWASLTWLASQTERIEFGPLVSPVSFRHPVVTAWTAAAVDDLSGGRLQLGIGAGWQAREHETFGFDLLDLDARFARFEEGLTVIHDLLHGDRPVSFAGTFFPLREALLLPRPARAGGPPIVIGGNGPRRTLPLAARFADEWNAVFVPVPRFLELSAHLDGLLAAAGRSPESVRRTLMTRVVFGQKPGDIEKKLAGKSGDELRARGVVIGDAAAVTEQLTEIAAAGAQRVMLQWLELDAIDDLTALAEAAVAAELGRSPWTVRTIWRRSRDGGAAAVVPRYARCGAARGARRTAAASGGLLAAPPPSELGGGADLRHPGRALPARTAPPPAHGPSLVGGPGLAAATPATPRAAAAAGDDPPRHLATGRQGADPSRGRQPGQLADRHR